MIERYEGNPILSAEHWPYAINTCFNPGAVRLASGETLLLVRVEDCRGISHLTAARSADGLTNWVIDDRPTLASDGRRYCEEEFGIEDARLTWVDELDKYVVLYTAYSSAGPAVSLATTSDFRAFDRHRVVLPPDNKDAAIFPERINGRFAMIHRPQPASRSGMGDMWIAYSPDLRHWGDHREIVRARRGAWWDANKIGLSTPPVKTSQGWLVFYHGAKTTPAGCLYRLGALLLAIDNPEQVIARSNDWLFAPRADFERTGDVGDVVFPCGVTVDGDTGRFHLYYGAADTSVAVAFGNVSDIIDGLLSGR
jgi:beta-1,4-mannooligosaccharide/beta-1,4-mannosyl-N-acetylglucosamine phosphorylase